MDSSCSAERCPSSMVSLGIFSLYHTSGGSTLAIEAVSTTGSGWGTPIWKRMTGMYRLGQVVGYLVGLTLIFYVTHLAYLLNHSARGWNSQCQSQPYPFT